MKSPIISVFSRKGGTGKSTIASNLAVTFSKMGYKVLAVDMDPQASLSSLFEWSSEDDNHKPKFTIGEVLLMIGKLHETNQFSEATKSVVYEAVKSVIFHSKFGVDLLPSSHYFNSQIPDILKLNVSETTQVFLLRDALELIKHDYDIILIDTTPADLSTPLRLALVSSNYGVVVMLPDKFISNSIDDSLRLGREIITEYNHQFKFAGILINKLKIRQTTDKMVYEFMVNNSIENNIPLFKNYIPSRSVINDIHPKSLIVAFLETKKTVEERAVFENIAKEIELKVGLKHDIQ